MRDDYGEIEGFRCWECGNIFQSMWGDTCNGCREKERRYRELVEAVTGEARCRSCGADSTTAHAHDCAIQHQETPVARSKSQQKRFDASLAAQTTAPLQWQPIETAPKDRVIDLWTGDQRMAHCYWDEICSEWRTTGNSNVLITFKRATHWMEIPAPPHAGAANAR